MSARGEACVIEFIFPMETVGPAPNGPDAPPNNLGASAVACFDKSVVREAGV